MSNTIAELKKISGLEPGASDSDLIQRVGEWANRIATFEIEAEERATVNKLIVQSCGALNEISARQVIKQRSDFESMRKKKLLASKR